MDCLICGSSKKKRLMKLCSNMDIMGPFFQGRESTVEACESCGHVYVDIDAQQSAFTDYYDSPYSKSLSYFEVFGREQAEIYYKKIYQRIRPYLSADSKVLEVGGGIGELALYLKNCGINDYTVLEPSKRCISLCREKGLNTIRSDCCSGLDAYEGMFDFVIINHTLEHILRFDMVLKQVKKMLKAGGHIYIEVPDCAMYSKVRFVPYWFFTYEHVFHMSLDSFENLGAAFGYQTVAKESYLKCGSYYVMYAVFKNSNAARSKIRYLDTAVREIGHYISQCKEQLEPVIKQLAQDKEPLILWGVGTSTAQLLADFDVCNVVKLVDSNPYRQKVSYVVGGRRLAIESPDTIRAEDGTIVILPLMYDASIRKQIEQMKLDNKVKSLIEQWK